MDKTNPKTVEQKLFSAKPSAERLNEEIKERRDLAPKTQDIIDRKQYVDYAVYAKFKGKIKM